MSDLIWRGSQEVIVEADLKRKLKNGGKLRIKYGIDPTADRIHIGHASVIRKLKYFQEAGHKVVLIVGDFTARIGDPSDKEAERVPLSEKDIKRNLKRYKKHLGRIVRLRRAEVRHNSRWFKKLKLDHFLELAQQFSVAQMIERDNFAKRFGAHKRIGLQEFLYPVLQGYDSVVARADVEIGGTDQLFNLLAGRSIQKHYGQTEQNVIIYELLMGPDGRKMSKSWNNCIWIDDKPDDMFGKLMGVNDELIYDYFRLATEISTQQLARVKAAVKKNPRQAKAKMAYEVTKIYHRERAARRAAERFDRQFKEGKLPEDIEEMKIKQGQWAVADLLTETGLASSKSEARRLLSQGGVKLNGRTVSKETVTIENGAIIQVGKRKFKKLKV